MMFTGPWCQPTAHFVSVRKSNSMKAYATTVMTPPNMVLWKKSSFTLGKASSALRVPKTPSCCFGAILQAPMPQLLSLLQTATHSGTWPEAHYCLLRVPRAPLGSQWFSWSDA